MVDVHHRLCAMMEIPGNEDAKWSVLFQSTYLPARNYAAGSGSLRLMFAYERPTDKILNDAGMKSSRHEDGTAVAGTRKIVKPDASL